MSIDTASPNIWVLSFHNFLNQWQGSDIRILLIAKWLFYCVMFTFPFALPIAYRHLALPDEIVEIRNEEVEGYDPKDYDSFVRSKYEKVEPALDS
jgi:hypothetical protein